MDTPQNPAYMMVQSDLPVALEKRSNRLVLHPRIIEMSTRADQEFQLHPDRKEKNVEGKIRGWNGEYFSVEPPKFEHNTKDGKIILPARVIRVSDDFAAAHFYEKIDGNQEKNPISSLGAYVSLFVRDNVSSELIALLSTRPETAFVSPNTWNSVGAAVPIANAENPLYGVGEKVARSYDIDLNTTAIRHEGVMLDTTNNITLLTGSVILSEEQVGGDCKLTPVPIKELGDFVEREGGINGWLPSGLLAICSSIQQITGRECTNVHGEDQSVIAAQVWTRAAEEFQRNPLDKKTILENLGLDFVI
tara:strand:+ start:17630 stop:18544 length:915 start_codon:yes stop_codon:yes gene_type:complete